MYIRNISYKTRSNFNNTTYYNSHLMNTGRPSWLIVQYFVDDKKNVRNPNEISILLNRMAYE